MKNFRSRKLLDLAHRVQVCTLCGRWCPDGCEPAHANWSAYGKGAGIKAHDCFHAALCHECHVELDQGKRWSKEERHDNWLYAWKNTMLTYFMAGWVRPTV